MNKLPHAQCHGDNEQGSWGTRYVLCCTCDDIKCQASFFCKRRLVGKDQLVARGAEVRTGGAVGRYLALEYRYFARDYILR